MSAPIVEFDGATYTITLFRADDKGEMKKEYLVFSEHWLSVCAAHENELESSERSQIKGEPDPSGLLNYIHAQPRDLGDASRVGLQNKEEALAIERVLLFLEENEDAVEGVEEDKEPCSFCGEHVDACGEDHGDEMRDWQRAVLEKD
jgi:hypothetical protein